MSGTSCLKPFLEALAQGPLLFDGAMGSLLYDRGVFHTRNYDELSLSQPKLIRAVHREYLEAGAQILETNTFGANRIKLTAHGHSERVADINRAAVEMARSVADDRAYVAGAVGPTGIRYTIAPAAERKRAIEALGEQIDYLVEAGVDLLCLETFGAILELEAAIELARQIAPEMPVVAHLVFDADGLVEGELDGATVAQRLIAAGANAVGANCGVGPPELYAVGTKMSDVGAPVSIQPNAGFPSNIDGRTIYVANPEHFGVFARRMLKSGVRMVGGCCGTTPEHVRAMLGAVRMCGGADIFRPASAPVTVSVRAATEPPVPREVVVPLAMRSRLGARLAAGQFAVSVELTAPAGTDDSKLLGNIRTLLEAGVDVVNIADGPRASARTGNLAVCTKLQATTGVEPILHVCTRDRNYLGLIAHLLGAHALGIRNMVIITGDPPKMGDYPFATPVYDVDSIGLLRMARTLNEGYDPAGKEIDGHTSFVLATGAEPAATDYEREMRRLEDKRAAGAELVMTQPVYDPRVLERFLDDAEPLGLPVMVGILPLASHRNAEFLHNEVPGMQIPQSYRDRMEKVGSGPEARAEGVRIAQEALEAVKHRVAGVYIMPPFNRVSSAIEVLDVVRDRWQPAPLPAPGGPLRGPA
ncbi:bifunctional homocysteine S-methyltransferase/methylenetetrahydrofolate reductase [Haliangium ochraceum]|uniref:Homocysteine S-methyltransferase n=1 Tax=Haliangium ochraceum (strain DSM 14365 / JCM 11303 / SMP-2) TaxID=502025 RepID=D0LSQ2_HALO1|nr:bifunctional homocysteine S-methyltransferase/methylenetetrahydrofolate reductase [Haliangium ochraceum]ACY17274.1 homocysteine S-methyltransferase [Haliangium ochraceum DSM 14365]